MQLDAISLCFDNVWNEQLLKEASGLKNEQVTELMHQTKRLAEVYISQARDSCTTVDIRVRVFCVFVCDHWGSLYALPKPMCINNVHLRVRS